MTAEDSRVQREARALAADRRALVERLRAAGLVSDPRVMDALAAVPRHLFVPAALAGEAYGDHALPIGHGQTITQAANVARSAGWTPPGSARGSRGRGTAWRCSWDRAATGRR